MASSGQQLAFFDPRSPIAAAASLADGTAGIKDSSDRGLALQAAMTAQAVRQIPGFSVAESGIATALNNNEQALKTLLRRLSSEDSEMVDLATILESLDIRVDATESAEDALRKFVEDTRQKHASQVATSLSVRTATDDTAEAIAKTQSQLERASEQVAQASASATKLITASGDQASSQAAADLRASLAAASASLRDAEDAVEISKTENQQSQSAASLDLLKQQPVYVNAWNTAVTALANVETGSLFAINEATSFFSANMGTLNSTVRSDWNAMAGALKTIVVAFRKRYYEAQASASEWKMPTLPQVVINRLGQLLVSWYSLYLIAEKAKEPSARDLKDAAVKAFDLQVRVLLWLDYLTMLSIVYVKKYTNEKTKLGLYAEGFVKSNVSENEAIAMKKPFEFETPYDYLGENVKPKNDTFLFLKFQANIFWWTVAPVAQGFMTLVNPETPITYGDIGAAAEGFQKTTLGVLKEGDVPAVEADPDVVPKTL